MIETSARFARIGIATKNQFFVSLGTEDELSQPNTILSSAEADAPYQQALRPTLSSLLAFRRRVCVVRGLCFLGGVR